MAKFIPDPVVARERYHVHPQTLRRWDQNPALGFPPVVMMNGRRYREAAMRRAGVTPPAPEAAQTT